MPIYEYLCVYNKDNKEDSHIFEKIVPMSDYEKPQICPEHNIECQRIEFSVNSPWVWGYMETHWTAGLGSNPTGMNHAKTHQTLYKEKKK